MPDIARPYDQVGRSAQIALTDFLDEFTAELTQAPIENWAETLGKVRISDSLATRIPVPLSTAGFEEFRGQPRYRKLFEKSHEVIKRHWQDGVAELATIVEAPEFFGWDDEPKRMALAWQSLACDLVVDLITTNPLIYDGQNWLDTDHPINGLDASGGVFANTFTGGGTAFSLANFKLAKERFTQMKAPNGRSLGLRMTDLVVCSALEEDAKDILENDMLIETVGTSFGAVDNRHRGTVRLHVAPEFSSSTVWVPLALNKVMRPWAIMKKGSGGPDIMILDRTSALYEKERKVGASADGMMGVGPLFPHCIQRYVGA
jgi:phage major head subunit gpT-like protein